ncbi:hypothetical protein E2C01_097765 [Portunus trituberculatus]|uniref:Uncharacterized protein n=1 Tax=Portunus trituberculatus TaxID=210409 RepID=A0A5B7K595_PORTR|nr:hypothetical protein [Portunus trituberculatus]
MPLTGDPSPLGREVPPCKFIMRKLQSTYHRDTQGKRILQRIISQEDNIIETLRAPETRRKAVTHSRRH